MANRIITASVSGESIKLSNKVAGAAGSCNAVSLAFSFDGTWDGTTKKVYFFDANGGNAVVRVLTADVLSGGVYTIPIPGEPLAKAGEITLTVKGVELGAGGVTAERVMVSATTAMKVLSAEVPSSDTAPVEPNATQTEQLQAEIDALTASIVSIPTNVSAAAQSATAAAGSATSAANSATSAATSATGAASSAATASAKATEATTAATNAAASESGVAADAAAAEAAKIAAAASEANAADSADAAALSESTATTAKNTAVTKASEAAASATSAAGSAATATTKATAASGSADAAASSATAADTAKTQAVAAKNDAVTAKTAAQTAAGTAATAKTDAVAAKDAAEAAASTATTAKTDAQTAKASAETAAGTATTKATEASSSAASALASKNSAATSATSAATSATNAGTSATAAAASETNAEDSAAAALTAKAAAEVAQGVAVAAKNDAVTAKTAAQAAQSAAETASSTANTAKNDAVTAKNSAQSAASTATTANTNAQAAKAAAEDAQAAAEANEFNAEAWAVGTRNGTAVETTDEAYHNNAKWYKDQAGEIVGGDYPTKSEAQGYASTAVSTHNSASTAHSALFAAKADATALAAHTGSTNNPHGVTAAQAGADPAGTAASAIYTHNGAADAHTSLFAGKSNTGHTHDDRYYTESEADTLLAGKAASSHNHSASNITSGTLPISRGGTGATSAAAARTGLGAQAVLTAGTNITISGNTISATGGILPRIVATAPTGSTVTCTKDATTLTATEAAGTWTFDLPGYGTWTVTATLSSDTKSADVVVDQVKIYTTSLSYLSDVFSENTWAKIIGACQSGSVPVAWVVGNQKAMTINSASYTVTIIGKNHDTYSSDGATKAPLTFQLQDCYGTKYQMNTGDTNSGGWSSCAMRTTHLPAILALMPAEAQTGIKAVDKLTSAGSQSSTINTTADKLFLLSEIEIFGSITNSKSGEGSQYAYYSAGNSKVKNFDGGAYAWWERSPYGSDSTSFCGVNSDGNDSYYNASSSRGVAFGFCF